MVVILTSALSGGCLWWNERQRQRHESGCCRQVLASKSLHVCLECSPFVCLYACTSPCFPSLNSPNFLLSSTPWNGVVYPLLCGLISNLKACELGFYGRVGVMWLAAVLAWILSFRGAGCLGWGHSLCFASPIDFHGAIFLYTIYFPGVNGCHCWAGICLWGSIECRLSATPLLVLSTPGLYVSYLTVASWVQK